MRLRANFRDLRIPTRLQEEALLHQLITSAHRYFLEERLKTLEIPGRTKIHKSFGWGIGRWVDGSYVETDTDERQFARAEGIRTILDNSNLLDWIEAYTRDYTLTNFLDVVNSCGIDLDGMAIRIERSHE